MQLYDLHIHTYLSDCADRNNAQPADYLKEAEKAGLLAIGFADHAWDKAVPGASPWYQKQPFERLKSTKEELEGIQSPVKVFFGAETEYADGVLGVSAEAAQHLDYIIVPHSHTHMKGFVLPAGRESPKEHAKYLLESFYNLCSHPNRDLFFGVAHPFHPVGASFEESREIFSHITDRDLEECMAVSKQNGVYLELNTSGFSKIADEDIKDHHYSRVVYIAKEAKNRFFYGSDKHRVVPFGNPDRFFDMGKIIGLLGLQESDFFDGIKTLMQKARN